MESDKVVISLWASVNAATHKHKIHINSSYFFANISNFWNICLSYFSPSISTDPLN